MASVEQEGLLSDGAFVTLVGGGRVNILPRRDLVTEDESLESHL
jgi:hypothetical protein